MSFHVDNHRVLTPQALCGDAVPLIRPSTGLDRATKRLVAANPTITRIAGHVLRRTGATACPRI